MLKSDFDALKLNLASPEEVKSWSHGEVVKPETINYRTLKPEKDGLFCERIFGPTRDYECYCGKYKRVRFKGVVCDKCGVEVTRSRVRRERMGHIELASPVVHTWYLRRTPSVLSTVLNLPLRKLETVVYFANYLVLAVDEDKKKKALKKLAGELGARKASLTGEVDAGLENLKAELEKEIKQWQKKEKKKEVLELRIAERKNKYRQQVLAAREELARSQKELEDSFAQIEKEVRQLRPLSILPDAIFQQLGFLGLDDFFQVEMGAGAVLKALELVNLDKEIQELKKQLSVKSVTLRRKATKRLKVLQGIKGAKINPAWMVLSVLPVIPPELRPMVQLPGGRFATSDLNDLYRRVINRNNRLKNLIKLGAPEIILQNERRMLQEAVDALIEGSRRPSRRGREELRSLSDMLKGKQGRFRQNLLGKRVDYSGRSVVVVGPELRVDQVGLPKEMALELFKPFILRELIIRGFAPNLKSAKNVLEGRGGEVWDILEEVTRDHPVLLNRAPTLHRQNIQAFYPFLIEGNAIKFHPIVIGAFAGDFDGDQLAVHVPLSANAIRESKERMLAPHNLLKLADGRPLVDFKNELGFGLYILTSLDKEDARGGHTFLSFDEAISAYQNHAIGFRTPLFVFWRGEKIKTSVGRIMLNEALPEGLRFCNEAIDRGRARRLLARCFREYGEEQAVKLVDNFKSLGQIYTTRPGVSFSFDDFTVPIEREEILTTVGEKIDQVETNFRRGLMTSRERYLQIIAAWEEATAQVADKALEKLDPTSMVGMIIKSASSRANRDTLRQVSAMRGLMVDSLGDIKETPIRTSMIEGMTAFEGFLSAIGGRKGLIDTALLTADAGYLTRRLVDVAHDILIRMQDCQTRRGILIKEVPEVEDWPVEERIVGRVAAENIKKGRKIIVKRNELITEESARQIIGAGIKEVLIRSAITCEANHGVCALCYGVNLASGELVQIGEAVGVIAAQSIGEPGTQLTLRTFHAGGIAQKEITQGLPRVEELFESRTPKSPAVLTEVSGKVKVIEENDVQVVTVISQEIVNGKKIKEEQVYRIPVSMDLAVEDGDLVTAGDSLTKGHMDLSELLKLKGILAVQQYLLQAVQAVYKSQGVTINDKHLEIIVRKMGEKVRVKGVGDSDFLPGELVDEAQFSKENARLKKEGKQPAKGKRILLGIKRAALSTNSWLSAASFEETPNVLAQTAVNIRPQLDPLLGLKENVIIGRLIPTGERAKAGEKVRLAMDKSWTEA